MAELNVYAGEEYLVDYANGSGIGFFGAGGFGYSVQVGAFQSTTYITNDDGTLPGAEVDNAKFVNPTGISFGSLGDQYKLTQYPQDKVTANLRFEHTVPVDVQNWEVRCYDGVSVDNAPSGINCKLSYVLHPDVAYIDGGTGSTEWVDASGASGVLSLPDSPGSSALVAFSGGTAADVRHDAYVNISMSPTSIGSKQAKLYVSLEYL